MSRLVMLLIAVLMAASPARAQGIAKSFEQLQVLVEPGDTVTVTDAAGVASRGKIITISAASLELTVNESPHTFTQSEVRTVTHRRAIPGKGAKWGFIVGTGIAVVGAIAVAGDDHWDYSEYGGKGGFVVGMIAGYAGLGAGVGAGIGALMRRPYVVYASASPSTTLRLLPVLSPDRKGVMMSLSVALNGMTR